MPKIFIPHTVEAHDAIVVRRDDPEMMQLAFYAGFQDVHYVLLPRPVLEKLAREIERELKAKNRPSEHR